MKASIHTLGCKVNRAESEYIAQTLEENGFEIASRESNADIFIINSCTVTSTADKKTRQTVRHFKRLYPNSTVVLTGCYPQAFPEKASALEDADIVLGNNNNGELLHLLNEYLKDKKRIVEIRRHENGEGFAPCSLKSFGGRVRAFVKIEDGCNRFCSYCIIPMSRGRVRSKPIEELKSEAAALAAAGVKEIVLVGINLSAYGSGENTDIADAVRVCADTPGILRVRLGSLEPDHITDEIISKLSQINEFCPQFHISLQSGCDRTLKNMNRHYTAAQYALLCEKLREKFKGCTLTTDVMVGFNGESEDDFLQSLEFVKSIGFEKAHVFPYSERSGTAASRRGDSVSKAEKERRAAVMIAETEKLRRSFLENQAGKRFFVLAEAQDENGYLKGYTKNYIPVKFRGDKSEIGCEAQCEIICAGDECCEAKRL